MTHRLVQISDTHLPPLAEECLFGFNPYKSLEFVIQSINDLDTKPDTIVVTGDVANSGTASGYTLFKDLVTTLGIPVYWLAGNHDKPKEMSTIADENPISAASSATLGAWRYIGLNSQVLGESYGHLSAQELGFLKRELEKCPTRPTLLALHHTPCSPCADTNCQLKNREELFSILDSHSQVQLILAGHTHQAEQQRVGEIEVFTAPSTFAQATHAHDLSDVDPEDFFVAHTLSGSRVGFRVFDLAADGGYAQTLHWLQA
ncbi:MAG: metallophosphoesterase [Granulosicoccaceae bacterium]